MLRTIFVLIAIAIGLRYSLKSPFHALLFYLWLAYFRPEQWVWVDFVSQLNLSLIIGVWVVLYTFLSGQRLWFGLWPLLFFIMLGQSLLSTLVSPTFAHSFRFFQEFAKVIIISYMMMVHVTTESRLRTTLFVIALSLGMEAAKQGLAQLVLNPGGRNPNPWPMLGDNNGVAIGMLMLFSYVMALVATSPKRWMRHVGRLAAIGVLYRGLSTYSRGGFLAAVAIALQYVFRSRHKVVGAIAVVLVAAAVAQVLPASFWERMTTIRTAAESATGEGEESEQIDESAAGRLHFWRVAVEMANNRPLTGVGHNAFIPNYDSYDFSNGQFGRARSVHSAWFGILGDLGYPGFCILVGLLVYAFVTCRRAIRRAKKQPQLSNLARYASGIEGALIVFVVAGSFFPFQYNEMIWHALALSAIVGRLIPEKPGFGQLIPAVK